MLYNLIPIVLSLLYKVNKGVSNMYFIGVLIFMIAWTTLIYFGYVKNI